MADSDSAIGAILKEGANSRRISRAESKKERKKKNMRTQKLRTSHHSLELTDPRCVLFSASRRTQRRGDSSSTVSSVR